ncbi:MAG: HAMP domain-containing sensor histidine kinase [Myxococcota bacterium]
MAPSRHRSAVRTASVAAVLVVVTATLCLAVRPEMAPLYGLIAGMGGIGWVLSQVGAPTMGGLLASAAGLFHPWYGLYTPEPSTTVVSEVGWLVLASCMAAATLRPALFLAFSTANATILLGLVWSHAALEPSIRWALAGLVGLLTLGGVVVAWQRRRLADDVERRETDLRDAELVARARAAAAEAARERLERAHTELMAESRTAVVGELSAAIGHEINNPLTTIMMASEDLALRRPRDPDVEAALELIRTATNRCREVVGRLLRHAELGDTTVRSVDFAAIAQDALELTRRHLEQHGAHVDIQLAEPLVVSGNAGELRQVVFNLLMHVATRSPTLVEVIGGTSPVQAWLTIRDDGAPMADAQRAAAFQPLLAGHPSPMIGLALCRTLVQRHGGQIGLTSGVRGCTFTVALPRRGGPVAG